MKKDRITEARFSQDELEYFRGLLMDKRKKAAEEIELLEQSLADPNETDSGPAPATSKHYDDLGADAEERQLNLQLQERARKFISSIDEALGRIENGTYGICQATGKKITKERLSIVPHTRYSMEAKELGLNEGSRT